MNSESDGLYPLVSCIMPTRNRRAFVAQSIWYFLRQDYPEKELIIVDDGNDAVSDLIPDDNRVRYIRLERSLPVGAKRNLACEMSNGELIAHWDDDDWMAPRRLSTQVSHLMAANALACGVRELLLYHVNAGQAWSYKPQAEGGPSVAGPTLLYRRSLWQEHPYPELRMGEDAAFLTLCPPEKVSSIEDTNLCIGTLHEGNEGKSHRMPPVWERRGLDSVLSIIADDLPFYTSLRNGTPLSEPRWTWALGQNVTVVAPFMVYDGYGSMAEYLVLGMARAGARMGARPTHLDLAGMSDEFRDILDQTDASASGPLLYFCTPDGVKRSHNPSNPVFVNTMWEASSLPNGWATILNEAQAVIAPTRFVAQVFRDSGVTSPVEVVVQGIDPEIYNCQERPERVSLTSLMVGTVLGRKHVKEGIAAWRMAFANDPQARLIIKARFQQVNPFPNDSRITFVSDNDTTRGILHWYRQADLLMALGSEGFGLPLVEGMATGLPVIALDSEGQSDICTDAPGLILPVSPDSWEPANELPWGPAGIRGVPGIEDVAEQLRWIDTHRSEARDMGRAASAWAIKNRDIWDMGPAMLDVMESHISPPRPLRRVNYFWVTTWGTPCGIAEFTSHLQDELSVRVSSQTPELLRTKLLHIQHEPGIFDDIQLEQTMRECRHHGVPTVITEHFIDGQSRRWEEMASALVAMTTGGAALLRERLPDTRVEHIPHGCPTWFPPRKLERGKVIGVFGFLEHYKGFWKLLDVLRAIEGTELLMFSHAKDPEIEKQWIRDSMGLPVRRVAEFESEEEIVRRLAAEADVLVFPHNENPGVHFASGSVRVGLATGVPVCTSRAAQFDDLGDAVYRSDDVIEGVRRLLEDTDLRTAVTESAREFCHENSWSRIASRHEILWKEFE